MIQTAEMIKTRAISVVMAVRARGSSIDLSPRERSLDSCVAMMTPFLPRQA